MPTVIPRRWGWVARAERAVEDDLPVLRMELVSRTRLTPSGDVRIFAGLLDRHAAGEWRWDVHARATLANDGTELASEMRDLARTDYDAFLQSAAPGDWEIEFRDHETPSTLPRTVRWPRHRDEERRISVPDPEADYQGGLIRSIETAMWSELPSITAWPAQLGLLTAEWFETPGVDGMYDHHVPVVLLHARFDAGTIVIRLDHAAHRPAAVRAGNWAASVEERSPGIEDRAADAVLQSVEASIGQYER